MKITRVSPNSIQVGKNLIWCQGTSFNLADVHPSLTRRVQEFLKEESA